MRPLILVLLPVVLFAGALLTAQDPEPAQEKPLAVPEPALVIEPYVPPSSSPADEQVPVLLPEPESPPPVVEPEPVLVSVKRCSDGAGTLAYETPEGLQVRIESERAQCDGPVAIAKDGKVFYGCPSGKIILDCDWFVESGDDGTATASVDFGDSYVVDFEAPGTSGLSCEDALIDPAALAHIGGNVCDLERLVGNLNQMHGG